MASLNNKFDLSIFEGPNNHTIPFENDNFLITTKTISKHFKYNLINTKEYIPFKAIDYLDGVFVCSVKKDDNATQNVFLKILRNSIELSCNCGLNGKFLCVHTYTVLKHFCLHKEESLKKYYWPGYDFDKNRKNKFLELTIYSQSFSLRPKDSYGNLFRPEIGFDYYEALDFHKRNASFDHPLVGNQIVLGFAVVWTWLGLWSAHLPFFLPFIGQTTVSGDDIQAYHSYLRSGKPFEHNIVLTNEQKELESLGNKMFELSRSTGRQTRAGYNEAWLIAREEIFQYWKKVIPILNSQRFIVSSNSGSIYPISDRPKKEDSALCKLTKDNVQLSFLLTEKAEVFTLELIVKVGEQVLVGGYEKVPLFVITGNTQHLVSSIQDEKILNFFYLKGKFLSVKKSDYSEFLESFLRPLNDCYSIAFRPLKAKRINPFDTDTSFDLPTSSK